jgi:4-amino-4-deoxy-L-arabinose transferase-like glycosyltransferase
MRSRHRIEAAVAWGRDAEGWRIWAVIGLWALVLSPFAGTRNLYYEEGRYTLAALDMFQNGHWLRPEVLGEGFVEKPPALFWLVASAISLGGVSEWVVRAPALLGALLGALLVERTARRRGDARAGLLAAVAFLLSPYVFNTGARAEPDLLVSVASFGAFTIWLENRGARQGTAIRPWVATAALLAATALLKGPLPLAYFGIGACLVVVRERRWRELPGLALLGGIALSSFAAWAFVVYQPGDEAAFRDMTRTGGWPPLAAYLAGVVRFVGETVAHLLPWLALAALPLSRGWRRHAGFEVSLARPFAIYAVGCTVPLALWPHAVARYAMPVLPGVAVLAGLAGAAAWRAGPQALRMAIRGLVLATIAVRLVWLAAIPLDQARNEAARRLAETLAAPLRTSRDPVLILGPAIDYNVAFYLREAGHSPRMVRTPGEIVPPAWLITAAPPPPGSREAARATGRRGVVYRVYRVETAD